MPLKSTDYPKIPELFVTIGAKPELLPAWLDQLTSAEFEYLITPSPFKLNSQYGYVNSLRIDNCNNVYPTPLHWIVAFAKTEAVIVLFKYLNALSRKPLLDAKTVLTATLAAPRLSNAPLALDLKLDSKNDEKPSTLLFLDSIIKLNDSVGNNFFHLLLERHERQKDLVLVVFDSISKNLINELALAKNADGFNGLQLLAKYQDSECFTIFLNQLTEPTINAAALNQAKLGENGLCSVASYQSLSHQSTSGFYDFVKKLNNKTLNQAAVMKKEDKTVFHIVAEKQNSFGFVAFNEKLTTEVRNQLAGISDSKGASGYLAVASGQGLDVNAFHAFDDKISTRVRHEELFKKRNELEDSYSPFLWIAQRFPLQTYKKMINKVSPFQVILKSTRLWLMNRIHANKTMSAIDRKQAKNIFLSLQEFTEEAHKVILKTPIEFIKFASYHVKRKGEKMDLNKWIKILNEAVLEFGAEEGYIKDNLNMLLGHCYLDIFNKEHDVSARTLACKAFQAISGPLHLDIMDNSLMGETLAQGIDQPTRHKALLANSLLVFDNCYQSFEKGLLHLADAVTKDLKSIKNNDSKDNLFGIDYEVVQQNNPKEYAETLLSAYLAAEKNEPIYTNLSNTEQVKVLYNKDAKDEKCFASAQNNKQNGALTKKLKELKVQQAKLKAIEWKRVSNQFKKLDRFKNEEECEVLILALLELKFEFEIDVENREKRLSALQAKLAAALLVQHELPAFKKWLADTAIIVEQIKCAVQFKTLVASVSPFDLILNAEMKGAAPIIQAEYDAIFKKIVTPQLAIMETRNDFIRFATRYIKLAQGEILNAEKWLPVLRIALQHCPADDKKAQSQLLVLIARAAQASFAATKAVVYQQFAYEAMRRLTGTSLLDKEDNLFIGQALTHDAAARYQPQMNLSFDALSAIALYDNCHQPVINGFLHLQAAKSLDKKVEQRLPPLKKLIEQHEQLLKLDWSEFSKQYRKLLKDKSLLAQAKSILPNLVKLKTQFELLIDNPVEAGRLFAELCKNINTEVRRLGVHKFSLFAQHTPYQSWLAQTMTELNKIGENLKLLIKTPVALPSPAH